MNKLLLFDDQDINTFINNQQNHIVNLGKVVDLNTLQQKIKKHCIRATKIGKSQERFQLMFDNDKQMNTQLAMLNMYQEIVCIQKKDFCINFTVFIFCLE